ncbi:zinc transporter ZupT [Candidatus Peregrinibacteria bacterium]|nr:zinc transporter ZupT [Candidatus Peregrinibacteria bacterium]
MNLPELIPAITLTLLAGLATGLGGLISLFTKRTNTKALSIALGFSAGVMIYISFTELLPESLDCFSEELTWDSSCLYSYLAFFTGIILVALIDKLLPSFENPHEMHKVEELEDKELAKKYRKLFKMGIITAIVISIHNFPEGIATFFSALKDLKLGIAIALAIAIHNIPEGIAVSIPIYFATGSRKKSLIYSFLTGLAEPLGAIIGFTLLSTIFNGIAMGIIFSAVAGIMVFISLDQLLPTAKKYGQHNLSMLGLVGGMAFIGLTMLIF